jgi:hypothetical protein
MMVKVKVAVVAVIAAVTAVLVVELLVPRSLTGLLFLAWVEIAAAPPQRGLG